MTQGTQTNNTPLNGGETNVPQETHTRLSDLVLEALKLALSQDDIQISEQLINALELSMTRATGGKQYVERREYPKAVEDALHQYHTLRREKGFE